MENGNIKYLNPSEIMESLEVANMFNDSVMIWGNPGIGKSQVVKDFAKKMHEKDKNFDENVIDIRLALKDPSDVQGLPSFANDSLGNKRTIFSLPDVYPTDPNWKGIIFLDEFNLSQPAVMSACYELIQDRRINNYKLPNGAMIISASNPSQCNINANELPQALKNRFVHFYMREDLDQWLEWAMENDINENIMTFLKTQKAELFFDYDRLEKEENTYATPRSWEKVSKVLNSDFPDDVKKNYIIGIIGLIPTTLLFNYIEEKTKFQNPEEIFMEKKDFNAKTISEFYGCFISLINRILKEDEEDKLSEYVANTVEALKKLQNKEWTIFAAKMITKNSKTMKVLNSEQLMELVSD